MKDKAIEIVLVDDDELTLELVTRKLRNTLYSLTCFSDTSEALMHLRAHCPDVLIVDQRMPRLNGNEFLLEVGNALPDRTFLSSAVPLSEEVLGTVELSKVQPILKEVLMDKSQLIELVSVVTEKSAFAFEQRL